MVIFEGKELGMIWVNRIDWNGWWTNIRGNIRKLLFYFGGVFRWIEIEGLGIIGEGVLKSWLDCFVLCW